MAASEKQRRQLGDLLKGIMSGTIDLGVTMIPLLGAYKAAKSDPQWREVAFKEWLMSDPDAAPMLERVLKQIKDTIPAEHRIMLIMALGGVPE